ncbi:HNH endonuclease [Mesobacillus harenae]|uniref:HNH endonuclease signature motif containing protein n=1 Tax=Mesobacillus harenae TaxID=2213203 RepID=UPI001581218E|nr:HNH endonuclease [Mesobacillus harenae]
MKQLYYRGYELSQDERMPFYDEENLPFEEDSEDQELGENYWNSLTGWESRDKELDVYEFEEKYAECGNEFEVQSDDEDEAEREVHIMEESGGSFTAGKIDELSTEERLLQSIRYNRSENLSELLKEHYQHTCQICQDKMEIAPGQFYTETHHLHPVSAKGPDISENMLVVCRKCHKWLDYGSMYIEPGTLKVHFFREESGIHGTRLTLKYPHVPGEKYLNYQREVFHKRCGS